MKDYLSLTAEYCQETNRQLFAILKTLPTEVLNKDTGSYFHSILGLVSHTLMGNLGWLSGFRSCPDIETPVLETDVLNFSRPEKGQLLHSELDQFIEHESAVDQLFIDLIAATEEDVLASDIILRSPSGNSRTLPYGKSILHVLNHQTHHRGAISQILDEEGVENDYSNLMYMFTPRLR